MKIIKKKSKISRENELSENEQIEVLEKRVKKLVRAYKKLKKTKGIKTTSSLKDKKKKFKIPLAFKSMFKKADKTTEFVPIIYITQKQQVEFRVERIVSGDIVVINNKAHTIDPQDIMRHKRYQFYIIREIDRKPVSNRDYEKIVKRGDSTDADVPIIKAVLGAVNKTSNPLKNTNIVVWILMAVGIVAAIVIFGGGGA